MPSAEDARLRVTPAPVAGPRVWRTNVLLFLATLASMLFTSFDKHEQPRVALLHSVQFTGSLIAILLAHEFGHYIAARIHKVDASLPYFLPMPLVSPFGTMGAVIRMRSAIPTRRALLDIGASGPLAGLVLAIPLYAWGVAHSEVKPVGGDGGHYIQMGSSLLGRALEWAFAPPVPEGSDLFLHPVAFAAWAGLFVTMINLLPVGQLDAGHVAYALLGPRQNRVAQWVHRSMLAFFFVSLASYVARDLRAGLGLYQLGRNVNNSLFWLVWFEVLAVLGTFSAPRDRARDGVEAQLGVRIRVFATLGLALLAAVFQDRTSPLLWGTWFVGLGVLLSMELRWGALRGSSTLLDHPPTGAQPLGVGRAIVAIVTLAFFLLLFMPTPLSL
ncbi:MAG TPA: site-2 protease family protein [Polyangiaceae bacterium]|jgi:membrane-associated protease RseP (regulator of RpoE activity)